MRSSFTQCGTHVVCWLPEALGCDCFRGPSQAEGLIEFEEDPRGGSYKNTLAARPVGPRALPTLYGLAAHCPGPWSYCSVSLRPSLMW